MAKNFKQHSTEWVSLWFELTRVRLWADPIPWERGPVYTHSANTPLSPNMTQLFLLVTQPFYQATFISNQSAGYNLTTSQTGALTWLLLPSTSVARQLLGGGPHSMARELPSNFAVTPVHFLGVLCTGTCTGRSTWRRAQHCSFFSTHLYLTHLRIPQGFWRLPLRCLNLFQLTAFFYQSTLSMLALEPSLPVIHPLPWLPIQVILTPASCNWVAIF